MRVTVCGMIDLFKRHWWAEMCFNSSNNNSCFVRKNLLLRGFNVKQRIWIFNVQISTRQSCAASAVGPVYVCANSAQLLVWLSHRLQRCAVRSVLDTVNYVIQTEHWWIVSLKLNCIPLRVGASINIWDTKLFFASVLIFHGLTSKLFDSFSSIIIIKNKTHWQHFNESCLWHVAYYNSVSLQFN